MAPSPPHPGDLVADDGILPLLTLPDPCPIKVRVDDRYVRLWIGPRDWQWDRQTGNIIGAGTCLPEGMGSLREKSPP